MSHPLAPPDEQTLRAFLLGSLAPDRAKQVESWLASDPTTADSLPRLTADDPLTAALIDTTPVEPVPAPAVERIIHSVLVASRERCVAGARVPTAETATPPTLGSTQTFSPDLQTTSWPAKLGSYRIVRAIGRGGMGVVLEADDAELKRRVAIKVMALERAKDPQARARFLREAQAAAVIDHENVVPIHHVGEDAGVPYIVMPLLRGESLQARLDREGTLPPAEVVRLGREVAAGLAAAHARGLVHRDVKPANIWLATPLSPLAPLGRGVGGEGRIKILDFGLARAADGTDGLTVPGAILGTPAYLAPEQVDGHPADARSDLFSLGATLYQCATGQRAFTGLTLTAILRAVTAHHPPPPHQVNPAVPTSLSDLIVRLIAKEPVARPQSAQEVAQELAALGAQTTVTDGQSAASTPRWSRRAILIGAAAAVLLLAVGGWLLTRLPRHGGAGGPAPNTTRLSDPNGSPRPAPIPYRGRVDILVERLEMESHDLGSLVGSAVGQAGAWRAGSVSPLLIPWSLGWATEMKIKSRVVKLRLNEAGALPLRKTDKFRIEGQVEPPAYLYVVWVDPDRDVTPVYPWDPAVGWGTRPAKEEPTGRVSLPPNTGRRYEAPDAKPGVATMVLFARQKPLNVPDEKVREWFEGLPDLPLPAGGDQAAVWFDDYREVRDPDRPRTFGAVGSDDAFARWQGRLQKVLGDQAAFQTAVSFARTGQEVRKP